MNKDLPVRLAVFILLFPLMLFCGPRPRYPKDTPPAGSALEPITVEAFNPVFDETARFIAGTGLPEDSPLREAAATKDYAAYIKSIDKAWEGFFAVNLKKIHRWTEKHLPPGKNLSVFYPFSGPDILHALSFYPDARDILMFGLEPTGGIPVARSLDTKTLLRSLAGMAPALNFTLNHAFFVTTDMQKNVGRNPFTGITGIMMFFLSRDGFEVVQAREIRMDAAGAVTTAGAVKGRGAVDGVEIIFSRGPGTRLHRARYFRLDVGNGSAQLPRFAAYCEKNPPFATIIKSASYLMHNDSFSAVRGLVLSRSASVIQDDSGIPYKSFEPSAWELRYFGKYHHPLPVFKTRRQLDLEKAVALHSAGPVPFAYGYGYGYADMTYHLLYARKKP